LKQEWFSKQGQFVYGAGHKGRHNDRPGRSVPHACRLQSGCPRVTRESGQPFSGWKNGAK